MKSSSKKHSYLLKQYILEAEAQVSSKRRCEPQRQFSLYVVTPPLLVATTPPVNSSGLGMGQKATAEAEWKNRKEGLETIERKGRVQPDP